MADPQLRSAVFRVCSYVSALFFLFSFFLFWVESNTCSLFVPRLVLFVLFSWVEDKKVHVLPSRSLEEGRRFPVLNGLYPSRERRRGPQRGSKLLSKTARLHGPPGSVTRNTGTPC